METQEDLDNKIGTKEQEKLKPEKVKIVKVGLEKPEKAKSQKVVCSVQHPDRNESISISSVKFEKNGKLVTVGLWYNKDEEGFIPKSSALAVLMNFLKVETIRQLEKQEIWTAEDDKGYLCFKAY